MKIFLIQKKPGFVKYTYQIPFHSLTAFTVPLTIKQPICLWLQDQKWCFRDSNNFFFIAQSKFTLWIRKSEKICSHLVKSNYYLKTIQGSIYIYIPKLQKIMQCKNAKQGSTNLIFACTDFCAHIMVLRALSCTRNYVCLKKLLWVLIYIG